MSDYGRNSLILLRVERADDRRVISGIVHGRIIEETIPTNTAKPTFSMDALLASQRKPQLPRRRDASATPTLGFICAGL
jgi:hypothetical protein